MKKKIPAKIVRKLIDRWRDRLNIRFARIYSRYVPELEGGSLGVCQQYEHGNKYTIDIKYSSDFDELRDVIIHELVHVLLYNTSPAPQHRLKRAKVADKKTMKLFFKCAESELELTVWRLVDILKDIKEFSDEDLKPQKKR